MVRKQLKQSGVKQSKTEIITTITPQVLVARTKSACKRKSPEREHKPIKPFSAEAEN